MLSAASAMGFFSVAGFLEWTHHLYIYDKVKNCITHVNMLEAYLCKCWEDEKGVKKER